MLEMSSRLVSVSFCKVLLELKSVKLSKVSTLLQQRIKESQWVFHRVLPSWVSLLAQCFNLQGAGPHPRQSLLAVLQVVDCNLDPHLVYQK